MKEHGFSLADLECMTPYEREIYIIALMEYLKQKKKQQGNQ